jgi:hypothetical protein
MISIKVFRESVFRHFKWLIKDEVLITVSCPIFPSILIAKYLFTGSLKNISIDNSFILNELCSRFVNVMAFILPTPLFHRQFRRKIFFYKNFISSLFQFCIEIIKELGIFHWNIFLRRRVFIFVNRKRSTIALRIYR